MRVFAITIALSIIMGTTAFSDVVYFKDGGKVEGLIKEETEEHIIIDLGIGTMTVNPDEIDYIEQASPKELEKLEKKKSEYEVERGEWAPSGYDDIRMLYRAAKDDKTKLQNARRKSQSIKSEIYRAEKKVSDLLDMLDKKGRELKTLDAQRDVTKYNKIVTEINTINAYLDKGNNNVKALYGEEKQLSSGLGKLANSYRRSFQFFKDAFNKRRYSFNEGEMTKDELYYVEAMAKKISGMGDDFKKDTALYTPEGGHIIVDAVLENSVTARLMVDTGASIIVISADMARRLGIEYGSIQKQIEIIVADGRTVQAKPIILQSVKVGDAEVKNVQAAILEKEGVGGADGLLGMSFLSHFIMKVDSATNKLILERVL
jgi:clan AA aspartic protease (TIGR02281 family)